MKILLIEDNPDHLELIQECCFGAFTEQCEVITFTTLTAGLEALNSSIFDIALIDLSLPDSNMQSTTQSLKELQTLVPIIVLTSLQDGEIGRQLIKDGAQDFLPKDSLQKTLLQRMVLYAIERKHHQVQLENRTRNQQTFCRSLSHDFKAPIRNVGQLNSILKEQLSKRNVLDSEDLDLFEKIQSRLQTMNRLVEGLYDYILTDQIAAGNELVDFNQIILELKQILLSDNQANASINYCNLPVIKGNRTQIFMLLQNIIENAIKYCKGPPVITITAEAIHKKTRFNHYLSQQIKIFDNGIGIDKRFIHNLFEPFRRLHNDSEYQGTGLGLSTVKRIMTNHKGEVSIQSELGKGTCITLEFP
ncbi:ATP-binding protein [uncultured Paraglaciecola sp.]|uniref:hybrid sensor histidine kinase/response regulator n=1 Tax=uncultured Paraglaciecola sp. TaxID=1765024 RepID=UPI0030DD0E24|tara:strand:- start:73471 stop:74553 length:1083 start_codon:yes stop_codon:yes gene_type:complete